MDIMAVDILDFGWVKIITAISSDIIFPHDLQVEEIWQLCYINYFKLTERGLNYRFNFDLVHLLWPLMTSRGLYLWLLNCLDLNLTAVQ